MLRKIVFCIADRRPIGQIEMLKDRISGEDAVIDTIIVKGYGDLPVSVDRSENLLFLADKRETLEALKHRGYFAVAFLHEHNTGEDLSAAAYAVSNVDELTLEDFQRAYQRLKGEPWIIMETARCMIRETTVEDVDTFYRIYEEPSITYYMEKLFEDIEDERQYAREYIRQVYGFYGYGLWSVIHKESGSVIGRAGLSWREGFGIPELGFVIAVPYQGKGYAYEVCAAILRYGKEELQFDKVQALIEKENRASVNLCRKLGFCFKDIAEDRGKAYERYIKNL